MPDVIEQLRRYGEAAERRASQGERFPAERSATRHQPPARFLAAAACLVLVASVAVVAALVAVESPVAVTTDDTRMVFSERTGAVLLFSDGLEGLLAIDLDNRIAGRRVIEGERPGDQPFRLTLTGEALIVGWSEIYAAPLSGAPSTFIDEATIYIPAAEPGEVWTLDYAGGRIGPGSSTLRRVDISGNELFASDEFESDLYEPLIGVPGGIAVASPEGIAIWDAESGALGDTYGTARPSGASSNGKYLAWCGETCADLQVIDLPKVGGPTPQHISPASTPAFSPDGAHVAFLAPGDDAGSNLIIKDVQTQEQNSVAAGLDQGAQVQWAPDGRQLFYATDSFGQSPLVLGRYDVEAETWEEVQLPMGGGLGFVVLDQSAASAFLPEEPSEPGDCPRYPGYSSGPSGRCGFGF